MRATWKQCIAVVRSEKTIEKAFLDLEKTELNEVWLNFLGGSNKIL